MSDERFTFDWSDLLKIRDALGAARDHHQLRDSSNAKLHMAPATRFSPLTVTLEAALARLDQIVDEQTAALDGEE
jgi:hypothetical protein